MSINASKERVHIPRRDGGGGVETMTAIKERRPDFVIRDPERKTITIADVAVTWDASVCDREQEKRGKYEALARDMGRCKESAGFRVVVRPFVVGDLGSIAHFGDELRDLELLSKREVRTLIVNCQLEALHYAVRIMRGHLGTR